MTSDGSNPNVNLFPLESAENDIAQAVRRLEEMELPKKNRQDALRESCLAELRELQQTNLLALRRALE